MASVPFHCMVKTVGPVCNLACDYCYYRSNSEAIRASGALPALSVLRALPRMADDVLEAFIREYITAQPDGTREVNFSWQGGEPTLAGDAFFERAIAMQEKYCRPGMAVTNAIQTNATLITRERARFFRKNRFLVGVSIDGPEALHDCYRKDLHGGGTFAAVMKGLNHLVAARTDFNTLTVVHNVNGQEPEAVYEFLKSIGTEYMQFIPLVEPSISGEARRHGAGVTPRSVPAEVWGTFLNGIFDIWVERDVGMTFIQHFEMMIGLYLGLPASLCVHSKRCGTAVVIERDGSVYRCDHFVDPEHRIGRILPAGTPDSGGSDSGASDSTAGLAEMVSSRQQLSFGNSKFDLLPKKCRECRYLEFCYGGCPKDRLIPTKTGRLNYLCAGYYAFYEHTGPALTRIARDLSKAAR